MWLVACKCGHDINIMLFLADAPMCADSAQCPARLSAQIRCVLPSFASMSVISDTSATAMSSRRRELETLENARILLKRRAAIDAIKSKYMELDPRASDRARPLDPDPERRRSKREWEKEVGRWRMALRSVHERWEPM